MVISKNHNTNAYIQITYKQNIFHSLLVFNNLYRSTEVVFSSCEKDTIFINYK